MQLVHSMSATPSVPQSPDENMVWIPGGTFLMGSDTHRPAARLAQAVDTSTCHVGLRLIVRP
jgi:formylglycine-generating enzyme required for sulfatase activity